MVASDHIPNSIGLPGADRRDPANLSRRGKMVRARQRAALTALRQAAQPLMAGHPGAEEQRTWRQWGRAIADRLGLL